MSCMFASNFEARGRVTSILEPENRPASLAKKAVSVKNGLKTAKNIFYGWMSSDTLCWNWARAGLATSRSTLVLTGIDFNKENFEIRAFRWWRFLHKQKHN